MDPVIKDPVMEATRVVNEGLEKALLAGIEQMMSQGALDPIVAARLGVAMRKDPSAPFAEIYVQIHEQMQKEQAAQQAAQPQPALGAGPPGLPPGPGGQAAPPGPPHSTMPGAAVPPGGAAAAGQPTVPPPGAGQQNLAQLVSVLGQGAKPIGGQ
jgi:hypothetical protein